MSDTPAVSLREARQREATAQADLEDEVTYWVKRKKEFGRVKDAIDKLRKARRATDEALVRAVLRWLSEASEEEYQQAGVRDYASAVLDAVEREEAGR